ncbi:hypothetical protein ACFX2A_036185 [Malus domestica]
MGLRRSVRLNATISGATAPPPISTTGTTTVATSIANCGEVHGAFTTAQSVPSKAHGTKATAQAMPSKHARVRAQASHSHASRVKQPAPDEQPTPVVQPTLVEQPAFVAQPALDEQPTPVVQPTPVEQPAFMAQPTPDEKPTLVAQPAPMAFQAAQVGPSLSQPSGPTIEPGAFSPYFFTDLTFPNSNLVHGVYHHSIAQGGAFLPNSSNPNGEQHSSRQVIELTSALAQQTTLVNQLLQHIGIQRAPDEVSRSRTRADEPFQQCPDKQPRAERSGSVHPRLGPRDGVYSRLSAWRSVHSRLGPRMSIHSWLGSHSDSQHEQPSGQSVHSWLSPQGASSTSHRSRQHDGQREAVTQSSSSSTSSL